MPNDVHRLIALIDCAEHLLEARALVRRAKIAQRHARKLLPRKPILRHRGVVHLDELQGVDIVHPHWRWIVLEEEPVARFSFHEPVLVDRRAGNRATPALNAVSRKMNGDGLLRQSADGALRRLRAFSREEALFERNSMSRVRDSGPND